MASSDSRNTNAQSNLHHQDLSKLDVTKLTALSREVISRQATINVGTIGHVAHGKSTVVKAISGVQTVRFKNELERNITIKLERLSETIVKLYRDRATEREENAFFEKLFRSKKKLLAVDPEEETGPPPSKKQKKNTQEPEVFIIEKILDFNFISGRELFHVKWKGYPDSENTWEPIDNLDNCPLVRSEFIANLELKHCSKIQKLKKEISFDGLLNEDNLYKYLKEFGKKDLTTLKETIILNLVSMITLEVDEEEYAAELVQSARTALQLYVSARKQCRQMMELEKWEEHINQVDKSKKLIVENNADFSGPPENFTYINESIPGVGVTIPDDPPIGCDCTACNCRSKTCCGMQVGLFPYTTKKRLRVASGTPVYECNKACKCSSECSNRVVQGGRNVKLCIYRTFNGCGWGVRTEQPIKQGQFICQYVGEIITFEEAEKRGREYDANGLTYLFDLDFNSNDNPYTIDAAHLGNVSHFINHSCDPNLGVWAVWADCLDPNLPMLALFATRDIEAGEDICFDYLQKAADVDGEGPSSNVSTSSEVQKADGPEPSAPIAAAAGAATEATTVVPGDVAVSPSKSRFEIQQRNMRTHRNMTECKCGAVNCRKYLF